jgi:membrane protein YqaA with SNARE-associated domain
MIEGMLAPHAPTISHSVRHWFIHVGGIGLIPLGLLDASVIPLPGSMDLLTAILAAKDAHIWPYYAAMATIGAVAGGYVTYRLARKGGKEMLSRRLRPKMEKRVYHLFERHGFLSIMIPAMLPPPMPMVPFVLVAGALQYPLKKFLIAMSIGRAVRYTVFAWLAAHYGRHILSLIPWSGFH